MNRSRAVALNALGLYGIALVLAVAFAAQLWLGELPCPLCMLQRIQFAMLAVGPILNVRLGPRPSHYALSLLAALAGAGFAARQVALHILPGDPGYGSALFGLHYYSWAFVAFAAAIALIAAVMLFDRQFEGDSARPVHTGLFPRLAIALVLLLTALNVVSTVLQCGFAACPDDPTDYELLRRLR
jgi:disulfide bond formation protein DsbB